jgi:signal transduction histidine kinase
MEVKEFIRRYSAGERDFAGATLSGADLALAEELARRAALAVDNARLYAEAQQLNAELEERVAQRTADLEAAIAQLENSRAQLLLLAQHEQTRREEDRARMAREIHDELGQALTGLKMDLAWLQKHTRPKQKDLLQRHVGPGGHDHPGCAAHRHRVASGHVG